MYFVDHFYNMPLKLYQASLHGSLLEDEIKKNISNVIRKIILLSFNDFIP